MGDLIQGPATLAALNALQALRQIDDRLNALNLAPAASKPIAATADGPSGLIFAASLELRAWQIGQALNMAARGSPGNIQSALTRMQEKLTQVGSDNHPDSERTAILRELQELDERIDGITK